MRKISKWAYILFSFILLTFFSHKILKAITNPAVSVSFSPSTLSLPPDAGSTVVLNSGEEPIAFVRLSVLFDQTKIQLTDEITLTSVFSTVIEKTTMVNANATGRILIVAALSPQQKDTPPKGAINFAQLNFHPLSNAVATTYMVVD